MIVGDSNMSEYATFLKVGTASIVLRMLEEPAAFERADQRHRRGRLRDLTLESATRAIREISHDPTCRRTVRLASGRQVRALDIQREYLIRAQRYAERRRLGPNEARALAMWEHCLTQIEKDPLGLDREVDWVIKHKLIEAYRERHGVALADPRVALIDLQYHDISRHRGLFYRMQERGLVERVCDDEEIDAALEQPPETRARLRGDFIRRARERNRDVTVDWVQLKVNDQPQQTILCQDPFAARDPRAEALIASL